jgi:hypothetical protein
MPPRRSARIAAVAERACTPLESLPHALLLSVFSLLAVDARAACCAVCRGWRAALLDNGCWLRLDLSPTSGVARAVTEALLRGAAARAGGRLEALDVSQCGGVSHDALLAVVTANAGTLRELRVCNDWESGMPEAHEVEALLRAAPQLLTFTTSVRWVDSAHARRMLRGEPPFERLRLSGLRVDFAGLFGANAQTALAALLTDAAAREALVHLGLSRAQLGVPAALDAVVAFTLAHRLPCLWLCGSGLSPASAPALARLLGGDALRELHLYNASRQLLDAPAATLMANALRANSTLTCLTLDAVNLWNDPAAAELLLLAATAHPSLRKLELFDNAANGVLAAHAVGALVAANAPALEYLNIIACRLSDEGMAPLVDALPANTHLRTLRCSINNISEAFALEKLLPAVRANTSLRALVLLDDGKGESDDLEEETEHEHAEVLARIEEFVAARAAAG